MTNKTNKGAYQQLIEKWRNEKIKKMGGGNKQPKPAQNKNDQAKNRKIGPHQSSPQSVSKI